MTYLAKPKSHHPGLPKNALGYTHRDYEGSISTLCAGCGHDSISGAIIQAFFELEVAPHRVAKLIPVLHYDGTPITARFIIREMSEKLALFNVTPLRKVAP